MNSDYSDEYLIFAVSLKFYGIKLTEVMGVVQYQDCVKFPLLKDNFIGFATIDEKPVPLLDLIGASDGGEYQPELENYIITVKFSGKLVGLLVNDVKNVIKVDGDQGNIANRHQRKISWQGRDVIFVNTDSLVGGNLICGLKADHNKKIL